MVNYYSKYWRIDTQKNQNSPIQKSAGNVWVSPINKHFKQLFS